MTLYDDLGVDPGASQDEIRRAYRAGAKRAHPDANPGDPEAAEKFGALARAYQVLSDPSARERYDRTGEDGAGPDAVETMAEQLIAEHFEMFLNDQAERRFPPVYEDIVDAIRDSLRAWIEATRAEGKRAARQAEEDALRWRGLRSRFKGRVFDAMIGARIDGAEKEARRLKQETERQCAGGAKAIDLLDGYAHRPDERPPSENSHYDLHRSLVITDAELIRMLKGARP